MCRVASLRSTFVQYFWEVFFSSLDCADLKSMKSEMPERKSNIRGTERGVLYGSMSKVGHPVKHGVVERVSDLETCQKEEENDTQDERGAYDSGPRLQRFYHTI
jgi:hypothetical protein